MEENVQNEVMNAEVANQKVANAAEEKWRKKLRKEYGSWTLEETLENPQAAITWIDKQLKAHAAQVANLKALRKEKLKELFAELSEEDKAAING